MKAKVYYYSNNIRKFPKGLIIFILLLFIILIPIVIGVAVVAGITTLLVRSITGFLPKKKKQAPKELYEDAVVVEEIEEKKYLQ
ncbi:MAG: hypothetical protein K2X86_07065 [Cytophagaceae bacterium]|nr:hypothetical protein [Cytophagaceae bacterium]